MINDLTEGSVAKKLIYFALPLMLSNLLQAVYNMVDMVVIGQFVGSAGLSGVSIGGDLLNLCTHVVMGFAGAGQIMIAQYVGQKDKTSVSQTIGTMFAFVAILAVCVTAFTVTCCDKILGWMNTPAEAWNQARGYTLVCYWGMVFIFGYNAVSSILRGMGDSKRPFMFIGIATVINLVLDLVFVAGFHWDAMGAALATVIGQGFSFIGSLIYLYRRRTAFGFDFRPSSFLIRGDKLKLLLKLGFPMALQQAAVTSSMLFVNSFVNSYGVVISAVSGVGNKLKSVMGIFTNSINTAAGSMVGQNMGAGKPERVKKLVWISFGICMVAWAVINVFAIALPKQIFSLFDTDPQVLEWAPKYMWTFTVATLTYALMGPFNAVINGIGYASLGFVIGITDSVVFRVGLSLLLGLTCGFGIMGFWYGNAIAGFSTVIPAMGYYYSGRWAKRKLLVD